MAYDAAKDQVLDTWENEETGLVITINQYGDGEPKVQIGPRIYKKQDGTRTTRKPGRLAIDDVLWISEVIEDIKDRMNDYFLKES